MMSARFQEAPIKPRPLFRVLLKLVGVMLFAVGISTLLQTIVGLVELQQLRLQGVVNFSSQYLSRLVSPLVQCGIAAYLFFGGEWIVQMAVPDSRPRCVECQYDLSHASGPICPECGTAVARLESERA